MSDNIKEYLQIVRYAKGHYKTSDDMMRDLRTIVFHITSVDDDMVSDRDILFWVHKTWNLWAKAVDKDRYFEELFYTHPIRFMSRVDSVIMSDVIGVMLSQLRFLECSDLGLVSWDELPEKYPVSFEILDNGAHPVGYT